MNRSNISSSVFTKRLRFRMVNNYDFIVFYYIDLFIDFIRFYGIIIKQFSVLHFKKDSCNSYR